MPSLYRKWRPQTFAEVSGQDHITKTLKQAMSTGRTTHAYLFTGPRGTGKTTMARILAKSFNCETRVGKKQLGFGGKTEKKEPTKWSGEPCNECESCVEIGNGTSLDVIEIDAASHTGVDDIRDLIEKAQFSPNKSEKKVYIIDEVHMLSKSAFNALLKTLEEPPKHVVFILATTEAHKVLATIVSRCQRYDFRRANVNDLHTRLMQVAKGEKIKIDEEVIDLVGKMADGSYRDGLSLLDQISSSGGKDGLGIDEARQILGIVRSESVIEFFEGMGNANVVLESLNKLAQEGIDFIYYTNCLIEGARRLILMNSGAPKWVTNDVLTDDEVKRWETIADGYNMDELLSLMQSLLGASKEIKSAPLAQLPVEVAVMDWWQQWKSNTVKVNEAKNETKVEVVESKGEEETIKPVMVQDLTKPEAADQDEVAQVDAVSCPEDKNIDAMSELDQECWAKIIEKMKPYNHSLHALLKDTVLDSMQLDKVVVKVMFRFHAKKLYETKNKILVEQMCEEVIGRPVRLECQIDAELPKPQPLIEDDLIDAAVETFGVES